MDFIPDYETLSLWLENYGSIALFFLLAAGIIALPVPEESLMVTAGVLIHEEILGLPQTLLSSYAGSMTGITLSYFIGRWAGHYALDKLKYLGLGEKKVDLVHQWFARYGKWTLFFGYFVPGLRHFTGLATGMMDLSYRQFALFAYCGAFFWVSTFVTIGFYFGRYGLPLFEGIEISVETIGLGIILLLLLYGLFYLYKIKSSDTKK